MLYLTYKHHTNGDVISRLLCQTKRKIFVQKFEFVKYDIKTPLCYFGKYSYEQYEGAFHNPCKESLSTRLKIRLNQCNRYLIKIQLIHLSVLILRFQYKTKHLKLHLYQTSHSYENKIYLTMLISLKRFINAPKISYATIIPKKKNSRPHIHSSRKNGETALTNEQGRHESEQDAIFAAFVRKSTDISSGQYTFSCTNFLHTCAYLYGGG
eukprot:TRINITY_DN7455_c0_g1_i2.p2 TRINITY_DN7455_c0_g1~~TRINITY_DN7455_c0_g1_i2.p2  ORF type:complete len:210 (-),score=-13.68 TRINITY_DN7455_c0_g1_i2:876-1505(-)